MRAANSDELLAFCEHMRVTSIYHDRKCTSYWPWVCGLDVPEGPSDCGICTNGARIVAATFAGAVFGYPIKERGTALVGADAFGHDFALVGDLIVDWWGWEYEGIAEPVMNADAAVAAGLYRPREQWIINPTADYRERTR